MASPEQQIEREKHIFILGAGVTGLSTALALLTQGVVGGRPSKHKYRITIVAEHFPSDRSPEYTSPWAGGHWRSHASLSDSEERVRAWDRITYEHWSQLLESASPSSSIASVEAREAELGLGFRESRNFWGLHGPETAGLDGSGLWWSTKNQNAVRDFRVLRDEEILEEAVMGIRYRSICFDPVRYITYLHERVQALGAKMIKARIPTQGGLEGVVEHARHLIASSSSSPDEIWAIINCAGLGARFFVGQSEADKLFPVRGQTMLIRGEALKAQTFTDVPASPPGDILYVVPRPGSGLTVFGGCKQVSNWQETIDDELNARILQGVKRYRMVEELENEVGEFELLSKQVGFRPGRKGGPRVEVEGKLKGIWVVHSYGHAGGGFQASWGCAEEVGRIVEGLGD